MQLAATLLFLPAIGFCQDDTTPPVLVSLAFPAKVDVTKGSQTITVTAHATDNLSGVAYGYIYFSALGSQSGYSSRAADGYFYVSGGTSLAAVLTASVSVPQYSQPGTWRASVYLYDNVGNEAYYSTAALTTAGFPTNLAVTSTPLPSTTPPKLTNFALNTTAVTVSNGSATVSFQVAASDSPSGVRGVSVYFYSPSSRQSASGYGSLTSGTTLKGVWTGQIAFPQYAEAGVWTIEDVYLSDDYGNYTEVFTADLKASGYPTTISVTSNPDDVTSPQLTNFSLPAIVDTSTSSQSVQGTLAATDNLSGFSYAQIGFTSPSNGQSRYAYVYSSELTSGTKLNGTYSFAFNMPQYSEEGTWTVSYVYLYDAVGNLSYLSTNDVINLGLNTQFDVVEGSSTVDGTLSAGTGGTVKDQTFGARAAITVPAGILTQNTNVSIDVLQSSASPVIPTPQGYSGQGSLFMNLTLTPTPPEPFPAPGISITVPVQQGAAAPGSHMDLYKIDTITGHLVPELSITGDIISGTVSADGLSVVFTGLASLSTVIGLIPNGHPIGDVNKDGVVNCTDVDIVKAAFGATKAAKNWNPEADVNNDGVVDINDLAIVLHHLPSGLVCK